MAETTQTESVYLLPSDNAESKRLALQLNLLIKSVYDGRLVYDQSVKISPGDLVLDAGTGNGSWAVNFAQQYPESRIYALDISSSIFPNVSDVLPNITLQQRSITSLPSDWSDKFAYIHQRFLLSGLLASSWPTVVSEFFRVLRPGASVQFIEFDCPGWVQSPTERRIILLWKALYDKRGLLLDCGMQLPRMLQNAGFADIKLEIRYVPMGRKAARADSDKLEMKAVTDGFRLLQRSLQLEGLLLSETEHDDLIDRMEAEWDKMEGGRKLTMVAVSARKPQ